MYKVTFTTKNNISKSYIISSIDAAINFVVRTITFADELMPGYLSYKIDKCDTAHLFSYIPPYRAGCRPTASAVQPRSLDNQFNNRLAGK